MLGEGVPESDAEGERESVGERDGDGVWLGHGEDEGEEQEVELWDGEAELVAACAVSVLAGLREGLVEGEAVVQGVTLGLNELEGEALGQREMLLLTEPDPDALAVADWLREGLEEREAVKQGDVLLLRVGDAVALLVAQGL